MFVSSQARGQGTERLGINLDQLVSGSGRFYRVAQNECRSCKHSTRFLRGLFPLSRQTFIAERRVGTRFFLCLSPFPTNFRLALCPMLLASRCPPDVLFQIFLSAVLADYGEPSRRQAPLNVSQTCRSWRHVALSSPRLWSYLTMEFEEMDKDEREDYMEQRQQMTADERAAKDRLLEMRMQTWLDRSGAVPLSFTLREGMPMDNLSLLLLQHQSRWQEIKIRWNRDRLEPPVLEVTNLRRLNRLSIEYYSIEYSNGCNYKYETMEKMQYPDRHPLYPDTSRPVLQFPPLHNPQDAIAPALTNLKIDWLTGVASTPRLFLLPMLKHSPNLEDLCVDFFPGMKPDIIFPQDDPVLADHTGQPFTFEDIREPPVHLPRLRSLTYLCSHGPYTSVLAHLRVPLLQRLALGVGDWREYTFDEGGVVTGDICEMLNESSAQVKTFVSHLHLNEEEWMDLYRSLPSVEALTWYSFWESQAHGILPLLDPARLGRGKWLLPNLKYLKGVLPGLFSEHRIRTEWPEETKALIAQGLERTLSRYFENGGSATVDIPTLGDDDTARDVVKDNKVLLQMVEDGTLVLSSGELYDRER